ncbi:ABC transporter permease [Fibrella forsythiae]|uniref:ABC transporter permease n=1 Tax=Fibrella forsythiae TaxID=2817061 RepID=A0ABS3JEH4_9BACT|nr:ABC transporter permease [Fibrella forsythiae]MBO0948410.1 ABC transporter permease [Fibrella forsythiae]
MKRPDALPTPPRVADRLLSWFVAPHLREEVLGDLHEEFAWQVARIGERWARWRYWWDVLGFVKPRFIRRLNPKYSTPNPTDMLRTYLKIALRHLVKNKGYSAINIGGLAVGMAVAMLIGLWMYDELSFNTYHQHYDRIALVMQQQLEAGQIATNNATPMPLEATLRTEYGESFKHIVLASWTGGHILAAGDKKFTETGNYMQPGVPDMLSLKMRKGTRDGLREPASILLAESVAKAYFGEADPIGQLMQLDNKLDVRVTGVYQDLPANSSFRDLQFIAPWDLYVNSKDWLIKSKQLWDNNSFQTYVQLADNVDMAAVSAQIKGVKRAHVDAKLAQQKPDVFLQPMSRWHLYSEWKNGVNTGGRIQYVWLFGLIGAFVLLLACINFMNLSTARSEKRAKEVGIRKAVGSVRTQLISQFFSESLLVVTLTFVLALLSVQLLLPAFNEIADKQLTILWSSPAFWLLSLGFVLLTGLIAGSYPAFYLSSFQAVKVLKGTFRAGRFAAVPRQVLVIIQFTVSVTLIIGTIIVFRQIQFAKDRPVGYSRAGLIMLGMTQEDVHAHFATIRTELIQAGAVAEMAESGSPATGLWSTQNGFSWRGESTDEQVGFGTIFVSHEFGKTVGWQFNAGRDFSRAYATDSSAMVLNEAAVRFMGLKNPVGTFVKWEGKSWKIIGVIKDMVMESPYEPVRRTVYMINNGSGNVVTLRINPNRNVPGALSTIEGVLKKYAAGIPFDYQFVDQAYAQKFGDEERIGNLAFLFAGLAIFISCLGLFGLASFMAEQRTKEIGVRKVLGASVLNLWSLLSRDFVLLVVIAFTVAAPTAWYFLHNWLLKYEYRTTISWWIFAASGVGALLVTLLTVSFQSIRAALMNPVKSLRSE